LSLGNHVSPDFLFLGKIFNDFARFVTDDYYNDLNRTVYGYLDPQRYLSKPEGVTTFVGFPVSLLMGNLIFLHDERVGDCISWNFEDNLKYLDPSSGGKDKTSDTCEVRVQMLLLKASDFGNFECL
jgi:hypothetical protein